MRHRKIMGAAFAVSLVTGAFVVVPATIAPQETLPSASAHNIDPYIDCAEWYFDAENYDVGATLVLTVDGVEVYNGTFGGDFYDDGTFADTTIEHSMTVVIDSADDTYDVNQTYDTAGRCTPPPVDVCVTIDGVADPTVQTTVPTGLVTDGAGNCTTPPTPPVPPTTPSDPPKTVVPGGATDGGDIGAAKALKAVAKAPDTPGINPVVFPFALGFGVVAFLLIRRFAFKPRHAAGRS